MIYQEEFEEWARDQSPGYHLAKKWNEWQGWIYEVDRTRRTYEGFSGAYLNLHNIQEGNTTMNAITKASNLLVKSATVTKRPSRKPMIIPAEIPQNLAKATGRVTIKGTITKVKRPKMVSDMEIGQSFIREGDLCIRVLNVCNNNNPGESSKPGELWIMSLNGNKIWMSSDVPVEVVDIEVAVVNK